MKAVRVHEYGGPDKMVFEDVDRPSPGPDEAVVRIEAAGVNYIDTYHRTGLYPLDLPLTLGLEGAGVVDAVGERVHGFSVGDRVAFANGKGAYAEYALCAADRLIAMPDGLDFRTAAAAMLQA